jgi:hypothetical protein
MNTKIIEHYDVPLKSTDVFDELPVYTHRLVIDPSGDATLEHLKYDLGKKGRIEHNTEDRLPIKTPEDAERWLSKNHIQDNDMFSFIVSLFR